jgi:alpha-D-xyloside xylohydrolase
MLLEFPDDRSCSHLDRQYMLGPSLLVAPVFDDEGVVEFYVPRGRWLGLLDGQVVEGPGWVRQQHGFHSLPLLVRPGSVIAVGSRADRPDYDDAIATTFEVFDLADGDSSLTHLYDDLGRVRVSLRVARHGSQVVADIVTGVELLTEGWRLTWAAGPIGSRTGPTAHAVQGEATLVLDLGQDGQWLR